MNTLETQQENSASAHGVIKFTRIVLRNSAFGMAAQVAIKVLSFVFSVFIVRNLGVDIYGQYSAVLAFGVTFSFIGDLGLSPYLVREVARLRDTPDGLEKAQALYGNVLALRLILSVLATILVTGTAWLTHRPLIMVAAIAINSLSLLLYGVWGASDATLAGFERLDISSGAKVVNQLVFVVLGAGVLFLRLGYIGLVLANVMGVAGMTYVCWQNVRRLGVHSSRPEPGLWWALLRASIPFGVITLALGLSYKFDSVLLNITRGDAETGFYNAAYNLVFSAVLISNVVNTALYPSLARRTADPAHDLGGIYDRAFRYLMLISMPIAAGIWALAGQIVPFLYTREYAATIPALQVIIWVVPLMFTTEFLGYIVVISNREKLAARSIVISTTVNVLANLILIPRYGYIAAAWMTVITEAILALQYLWLLRSQLASIAWKSSLARPLIAALLMSVVVVALRHWVPLFANVTAGALLYGLLCLALGAVGREDLAFVRRLRAPVDLPAEQP
jgi:O-antigen/teichoic acid export membrane protein